MKKLFVVFLAVITVCAFIFGCSKTDEDERKNGVYYCEVTVNGEKNSESIQSPVTINIKNGSATASIVWKSSSIEYIMVKGKKYGPINASKEADGNGKKNNSTFVIPMDFDMDFPVSALNTDVDAENLTEYVLYFSGSTLRVADNAKRR